MPDYVRIRDVDTGHHISITREKFDRGTYTELDQPAVDAAGDPLPPKYKTTVSSEAEKKAGKSAEPQKEISR